MTATKAITGFHKYLKSKKLIGLAAFGPVMSLGGYLFRCWKLSEEIFLHSTWPPLPTTAQCDHEISFPKQDPEDPQNTYISYLKGTQQWSSHSNHMREYTHQHLSSPTRIEIKSRQWLINRLKEELQDKQKIRDHRLINLHCSRKRKLELRASPLGH